MSLSTVYIKRTGSYPTVVYLTGGEDIKDVVKQLSGERGLITVGMLYKHFNGRYIEHHHITLVCVGNPPDHCDDFAINSQFQELLERVIQSVSVLVGATFTVNDKDQWFSTPAFDGITITFDSAEVRDLIKELNDMGVAELGRFKFQKNPPRGSEGHYERDTHFTVFKSASDDEGKEMERLHLRALFGL